MFVFSKMNMFLLSSLSNMINDSVSHWFGGRWVGSLIFIFSILTINKKQIWLPEAVTRIFNYSWRYISILTSNKTNRVSTATSSNISFVYKTLLQTFRKSISLVKRILLGKPIHMCFLRNITKDLTRATMQNTSHFGIFSIILSICCCYLVVYYLTKHLWNCVSASQICCLGCCSLS